MFNWLRNLFAGLMRNRIVISARTMMELRDALEVSRKDLSAAVAAAGGVPVKVAMRSNHMNPLLQQLVDQIKANTDAEASAVLALNGVAVRIDAAVAAALAGGVSAADLAKAVNDEVALLKASAAALGAAVVANTPATP